MMMTVSLTCGSPIRHRGGALLKATEPAAPQTIYETIATSIGPARRAPIASPPRHAFPAHLARSAAISKDRSRPGPETHCGRERARPSTELASGVDPDGPGLPAGVAGRLPPRAAIAGHPLGTVGVPGPAGGAGGRRAGIHAVIPRKLQAAARLAQRRATPPCDWRLLAA